MQRGCCYKCVIPWIINKEDKKLKNWLHSDFSKKKGLLVTFSGF